jgi:hypothetical protein
MAGGPPRVEMNTTETIRGRIVDPHGAPLSYARVWIDRLDKPVETDSCGYFRVQVAGPTQRRVRVEFRRDILYTDVPWAGAAEASDVDPTPAGLSG